VCVYIYMYIYILYHVFHNISITGPYPISQKTTKLKRTYIQHIAVECKEQRFVTSPNVFDFCFREQNCAISLSLFISKRTRLFFYFVAYKIKFPEERNYTTDIEASGYVKRIIFCALPRFE